MKTKTNPHKNGRCPECSARLYREDFLAIQEGQTVVVHCLCPICGYEGIVETKPVNEAQKRRKGKV